MASVNKVIIVGNLGRDPELRHQLNGEAVANIAVATSFQHTNRATGETRELTEWHRIAFFGRLAEIVAQYMRKGSSIYVEGRLHTRKYTDKDGIERYATDIIAENMQMLGGPAGHVHSATQDGGASQADPSPAVPEQAPQAQKSATPKGGSRRRKAPAAAGEGKPETAWDEETSSN